MLLGSYGMGIAWQTIGFQPFGTLAHPTVLALFSIKLRLTVGEFSPSSLLLCFYRDFFTVTLCRSSPKEGFFRGQNLMLKLARGRPKFL